MRKMLRSLALRCMNTRAFGACLTILDRHGVAPKNRLSVVTYHRIDYADETPELYPGLISATPEQFDLQLEMLAKRCHVVSMQEVVEARQRNLSLPARSLLITFDDASTDFAEHAWPRLRARNLPATVFVPTAYPDQPQRGFWWNQLYAAICCGDASEIDTPHGRFALNSKQQRSDAFRSLLNLVKQMEHEPAMRLVQEIRLQGGVSQPISNVLSWDRLRELQGQGVTLAAHTQTHPLLTKVSIQEAKQEIEGSFDDLRREIGDILPVFAYPGGDCNDQVVELLRSRGCKIAFTVQRGVNDLSVGDPLRLKRINIGQATSPQVLLAQLLVGRWRKVV